jgi:hypothetical protein
LDTPSEKGTNPPRRRAVRADQRMQRYLRHDAKTIAQEIRPDSV